jgi:hypothetical protein
LFQASRIVIGRLDTNSARCYDPATDPMFMVDIASGELHY